MTKKIRDNEKMGKTIDKELLYYWLSTSRVSALRISKLLEIYDPFELFHNIDKYEMIAKLVGQKQYELLKRSANVDYLENSIDKLYKYDVKFITLASEHYPEKLKQKEVSPPPILYYKGDISLLKTNCVAIVGTRRVSTYGKDMARKFGSELAEHGLTIVSGLATGVDTYAHESCLSASGKTIAVLGTGHNKISPVANTNLCNTIIDKGLVISEYPPTMEGSKYSFPERNRIISGLSEVVVIVEASGKSGSLITARLALEQNREVFAIPGNITSPKSEGTNELIKSGASVLTKTQDILNYFSIKNNKINDNFVAIQLDIYEQKLYNLLQNGEMSFDELCEKSGFTVSELLSLTLSLEVKNVIQRMPNNIFTIKY